jgi:hypothetical protein
MDSNKQKKPVPGQRWGQIMNGRLNDKQIFDLFDEFGMAKRLQTRNDYDWVRQNLPNMPEEIKKILKIELDKEMAVRKAAAKPAGTGGIGNSIVKPVTSSGGPGPSGDGQGGPNDDVADVPVSLPTTNNSTQSWTTDKNLSLVKFANGADPYGTTNENASTVWVVDHSTNTLRPIMSAQALQDMYPNPAQYQAALNSITTLPQTATQPGGVLGNYTNLGVNYGVFEGGKTKPLSFNPNNLSQAYGQTRTEEGDVAGAQIVNSWLSYLGSQPNSGISSATLNEVKNDPNQLAMYINAVSYGGYSNDDIYKDLMRQQLVNQGQTNLQNVQVINDSMNRSDYLNTESGNYSNNLSTLTPPSQIGNMNREIWSSPAATLDDSYFAMADPGQYDPTSKEFQQNLAALKPALYDYVVQNLTAETEAQKQAADANYQMFSDNLQKTYGIQLGSNALQGWNMIGQLQQQQENTGIQDSGVAMEQQEQALKQSQLQAQGLTQQETYQQQTQAMKQAQAYATPDDINQMNQEDQAKGLPRSQWRSVQWGLAPANETDPASFIATFKANHPDEAANMTDDQIKSSYYDPMYDQNGNLYSTSYKNLAESTARIQQGWAPDQAPYTPESIANANTLMEKNLQTDLNTGKDATPLSSGNAFNPTQGKSSPSYAASWIGQPVPGASNSANLGGTSMPQSSSSIGNVGSAGWSNGNGVVPFSNPNQTYKNLGTQSGNSQTNNIIPKVNAYGQNLGVTPFS